MKKGWRYVGALGIAALASGGIWALTPRSIAFKSAAAWQKLVNPGPLSAAHATLEEDCAACHTPIAGAQPDKCVLCHANAEAILKRPPTAFHAHIQSCNECHLEHRGRAAPLTVMDHSALARIGLRQLNAEDPDTESARFAQRLESWMKNGKGPLDHVLGNVALSPQERSLNCRHCHGSKDRHFQLFGKDCGACHATDKWGIDGFRHPSPNSKDCSQCHQAPPSHYMMHFKMISAKVAGKPHAKVEACYACHQTTSWNDIKNAGFYKHH